MPGFIPRPIGHAVAAILIVGAVGGCKGRQGSETAAGRSDSGAMAMDTMSSMSGRDTAAAGSQASGTLSDANIVALLDEANMADSASGAYALSKATSPDVKSFAKLMMGEHHALRVQGSNWPSGSTSRRRLPLTIRSSRRRKAK